MSDILDDIQDEIGGLGTDDDGDGGDDGGDPYDPTQEFRPIGDPGLTEPEPIERDLDHRDWGITGEGTPALLEEFTEALNAGQFDGIPLRLDNHHPDWGDPMLPFAISKAKPRGKTLVVRAAMTPESMAWLQGEIGARQYGDTPNEFMAQAEEGKVSDYADQFRAGERPGPFVVEMDHEGDPSRHQEGRHRAMAAIEAGFDWVPFIGLWDTEGTFERVEKYRKEDGPGYWSNYPGEK